MGGNRPWIARAGTNCTTTSVTPPNRYALRSERIAVLSNPRMNTAAPKVSTFGPNWLATIAPTTAPSAVPTKRCQETLNAAPKDDCVMTSVVIGAQYASGSLNILATNSEVTAATAVRAECATTGNILRSTPCHPCVFVKGKAPSGVYVFSLGDLLTWPKSNNSSTR